jgi:MbtH protein
MQGEEIDLGPYRVVRNDEEQYSIWPADREVPAGWQSAGFEGSKDESLAYIREVWTDMRPKSARRAAVEAARG